MKDTNQNGLLTYKERRYKVGNARIELPQITGLACDESHVRGIRDRKLTYVQSMFRTQIRLFELSRNRLHIAWQRNVKTFNDG